MWSKAVVRCSTGYSKEPEGEWNVEVVSIWIQPAILMAAFIFFWREARGSRQEVKADMLQIESRIVDRINDVDKRFDRLDERMNAVEIHLGRLDERMNAVEIHLGRLDERMNAVEIHLGRLDERMTAVEGHQVKLYNKVDKIANDISVMKQGRTTSKSGSTPVT